MAGSVINIITSVALTVFASLFLELLVFSYKKSI